VSVLEKLWDALEMFWQALDYGERYWLTWVLVYGAVVACMAMLSSWKRSLVRQVADEFASSPIAKD
jgi:hypothetical protein